MEAIFTTSSPFRHVGFRFLLTNGYKMKGKKNLTHMYLTPPPSALFNRPQPVDKANCSLRTLSKKKWR